MVTVDPSSYSVGSRIYRGGSSAPNIGPVTDKTGYAERDRAYRTRMRLNALKKRAKAKREKRYMSSEYLSAPDGRTV
jgi:hypothetical protein